MSFDEAEVARASREQLEVRRLGAGGPAEASDQRGVGEGHGGVRTDQRGKV